MGRAVRALLAAVAAAAVVSGCAAMEDAGHGGGGKLTVVATTNLVADLARQIGGADVDVVALMGPGVDPHLYKASAGDVETLAGGDVILYNGLHLEGRMADLFEELAHERVTVAVAGDIPTDRLVSPPRFEGNYDPHVWFDPTMWRIAAGTVARTLAEADPLHEPAYRRRLERYQERLDELDRWIRRRVEEVPERSRVLVTSHDAFGYFGLRYGFTVEAIQGISTATEATTDDVKRVAAIVAERGLRTVFLESSVPPQTIEAVLAAAAEQGGDARVGGQLFSDSAGAAGTPEATYVGMLRHNVDAIVAGLR
jgi:manganese/zinc/iron transport system substrate-binding protein